ncbi:CoA transferase [Adhaeribacter aerolatus]|uniref:CoA transferase n=2 Tax=Adhaeribacter aerolatus TaxID=670289 RepID=A0A512AXJ0_9BACT|nr:CoA transferase [Adhaeribacter aerolatus]
MAGPSAGLRLADLGARVIKIERPGTGEGGRKIAIKNLFAGDDSIVFHTINRNKESYEADLKNPADLDKIKKLIEKADVLTHNFRPGIMEKIGLGYEEVKNINPRLVYGVVTGYGSKGPWAAKPGQDLLVQSMSGLTYLSGDKADDPTPFGIAVADIVCGAHLTQGILAALVRRGKTQTGSLVEVSLLESVLDLQFELLTTYLNDGKKEPVRAARGNANAYLSAPYGVYQTRNGYLALAMENLVRLGIILDCEALKAFPDSEGWFTRRDEIMAILNNFLQEKDTAAWLSLLEPADIWCAEIFNYQQFLNHDGYKVLQMDQEVVLQNKEKLRTTRCPIRIDGGKLLSDKPGPLLGQHTLPIDLEFNLATA